MPRTHYLRAGPWQSDLVTLCRQRPRPSDAAIARELTNRHPPHQFSRRMVFRYRRHYVERAPGGRLDVDCATLTEAAIVARRIYQLLAGLGDLLPDHELTRRESDVLSLLRRAEEPLAHMEIALCLGVCLRAVRGQSPLAGLLGRGLVCMLPCKGGNTVPKFCHAK